ncbi:MAG: hypothetical protein WCP97_00565 [bacterium]
MPDTVTAYRATLKGKEQPIKQSLSTIVTVITIEAQNRIKEYAPHNTGQLKQGIQRTITTSSNITGKVYPSTAYAAPIEDGSRPHWAPIEPLKIWAKQHGMKENAAYAIQKKIAKNGTKARPFFAPAIADVERQASKTLEDAGIKILGILAK